MSEEKAVNTIDIMKIPIKILRVMYFDYRLIPQSTLFGITLHEPYSFVEGLWKLLPPDEAIENIRKKYFLPKQFIIKTEHSNRIYVYLISPCFEGNSKLFGEDMNKMGYFLTGISKATEIDDMRYQILQFEPLNQVEESMLDSTKERFKSQNSPIDLNLPKG